MQNYKAVQIIGKEGDDLVLKKNELKRVLGSANNHPVSIISVCGDKRKGKSFILNLLLRHIVKVSWEIGFGLTIKRGTHSTIKLFYRERNLITTNNCLKCFPVKVEVSEQLKEFWSSIIPLSSAPESNANDVNQSINQLRGLLKKVSAFTLPRPLNHVACRPAKRESVFLSGGFIQ